MSLMYGDDLQAIGAFLVGLQKLCTDTKIDVAAEAEGIAIYHEGDILGYVGMYEDTSYTFKPFEATK